MIKQFKLALQIQKFGFQRTMQLVCMAIMVVVGIIIEAASQGVTWLGSFFIALAPMFLTQIIYSFGMSNLVATSPYKKRLQTTVPAVSECIISLISMTVIVGFKIVEIHRAPEHTKGLLSTLMVLCVLMALLHLYTAVVFKYYALSVVLLLVIVWPMCFVMGFSTGMSDSMMFEIPFLNISLTTAVIISYLTVFVSVFLQYLLSCALYRKPMSKYAQGMTMRKYLK